MFAFTAPTAIRASPAPAARRALDVEVHSMGSPMKVPVPWVSMYPRESAGTSPACKAAWMAAAWPAAEGALKPALLEPSLLTAEPMITPYAGASAAASSRRRRTTATTPDPPTVPPAWASNGRQRPSAAMIPPRT